MTKRHRRGHIYLRGNIYWIQYMVEGKLIRESLETDSKSEAEKKRVEKMRPLMAAERVDALAAITRRLDDAKIEAAALADKANPPLRLDQAWDAYLNAENRPRRAGEHTLPHYAGHLKAFIAWMKEHHSNGEFLRDVSAEMAAGFFAHLDSEGLSGNRINKYRQFLKTLFRVLRKPARLSINPFEDIARREHISHTKRPLTVKELKHVIASATGEMKTLFMLGTYTGLRLGDCATLKWCDVDLDRAIIRRVPNKTRRTGKVVIVGIPVDLKKHLVGLKSNGPSVIPEMAALYERDIGATLTKRIGEHLTACGIETTLPGTGGKNEKRAVVTAGFHSLRHSFVSLHAQVGTAQAVLQKLAGHGNPMMTEHYTHISESTALSTAKALTSILRNNKRHQTKMIPAKTIRAVAKKLTADNGLQIKEELLAVLKTASAQ